MTRLPRRAVLLGLALAGCEEERPTLPSPAPGLASFEKVPFGSTLMSLDLHALQAVLDQVQPRFGRVNEGKLDIHSFQAPADLRREDVEAWYAGRLQPQGMAPLRLFASPGSWVAGFEKGGAVLAVEALVPYAPEHWTILPVNVVTNLKPGPSASPP